LANDIHLECRGLESANVQSRFVRTRVQGWNREPESIVVETIDIDEERQILFGPLVWHGYGDVLITCANELRRSYHDELTAPLPLGLDRQLDCNRTRLDGSVTGKGKGDSETNR
jgi:hypothetical protein